MTKRQIEFLRAIDNHWQVTGGPPSLAELAKVLGVNSRGTVQEMLLRLRAMGLVRFVPGVGRTIELTDRGLECLTSL